MSPAILSKIPIYIKNTFDPNHEGTRIYLSPEKGLNIRERSVCGFTTVDNISLLNLEGTGMIGVPGIAHRLFGALKVANISVLFIAQASSEHSICFATTTSTAQKAKLAIEEAFFYELKQSLVSDIQVINDCSIIAAVGDRMSDLPGVSGLFFGALGGASINILSISQGCNERNISAVVSSKDATKALRAVHSAFWLSSLDISVGIIGTGRVGSALIQTLLEQNEILSKRFDLKINILGVANSQKMILGDDLTASLKTKMSVFSNDNFDVMKKSHSNVSLKDLENVMSSQNSDSQNTDLEIFLSHLKSGSTPHVILIDASTSKVVANLHPFWLKSGCHVVTANKRALASNLDLYNEVFSSARSNKKMYMSEVTIGASLPIRTTLNDILCSGDAVHSILGLMSVSAGVVLTDICENGLTFSEAVQKTYSQGLFEDDPFADLEGTEACEKLLILARDMGIPMNKADIFVENLARRKNVLSWNSLDDIFSEENKIFAEKALLAKSHNSTLRYIQRIECIPPIELGKTIGKVKASIKLEEVPLDSPLAKVKGAVYFFSFHTERYQQHPLIIQVFLVNS